MRKVRVCRKKMNAGGGTRTPDTRIMIARRGSGGVRQGPLSGTKWPVEAGRVGSVPRRQVVRAGSRRTPPIGGGSTPTFSAGNGGELGHTTLSESTRTGPAWAARPSLPSGSSLSRCGRPRSPEPLPGRAAAVLASSSRVGSFGVHIRPSHLPGHYPPLSGEWGGDRCLPSLSFAEASYVYSRHRGEGSRSSPICAERRCRQLDQPMAPSGSPEGSDPNWTPIATPPTVGRGATVRVAGDS
jgi:hypothetical protein